MSFRTRTAALALAAAALATSSQAFAQSFTPGNLAIFAAPPRTGTAVTSNALVSIIEVNPAATGPSSAVSAFSVSGSASPLYTSASGTSTGYLTLSNDRSRLLFTGHTSNGAATANINTIPERGVGVIDSSNTYARPITYNGASGDQTRGATTFDNSQYLIADQAGVYARPTGNAGPNVVVNARAVKTFGGTTYVGRSSTTLTAVAALDSSTAPTTAANLPGFTFTSNNFSDYTLLQSTGSGTFDTLYVTTTTTLNKYLLSSGSWTSAGAWTVSGGLFGIAARLNPTGQGVELFATTGTGGAVNTVVRYLDPTLANPLSGAAPAPTVLFGATSVAAGTVLKGISFTPGSPVTLNPAPNPTDPRSLTWAGPAGSTWNTAPANTVWTVAGVPTFYNEATPATPPGDFVTFGDTGAGTVTITPAGVSPQSTTFNAAADYTLAGGPLNGGALIKQGTGTLTLSQAASSHTGLTLSGGTLVFSSDDQLGNPAAAISLNGGTLRPASAYTTSRTLAVTGPATLDTVNGDISATTVTFAGNSKLTKAGPGTLSFSGSTVAASTAQLSIPAGAIVINAPQATREIPASTTAGDFAGNIVLPTNQRLNFVGSATSVVSGGGKIILRGLGLPSPDAAPSSDPGTYNVSSIASSGGRIDLANEIVVQPDAGSVAFRLNLGATSGNTLVLSGGLSQTPGVPLDVNFAAGNGGGAGTVVLNSALAHSGRTSFNLASNGVVRLAVDNPLPTSTALSFGDGFNNDNLGSIDLNGRMLTVGSLSTNLLVSSTSVPRTARGVTNGDTNSFASLVVTGSATTTYSGGLGSVSTTGVTTPTANLNLTLAPSHTGKLTLTASAGSVNYSGTTTISGGTLEIGNGGTTGTLGSGTGPVVVSATLLTNRSDAYTVSNPLSGTGTVRNTGPGTTRFDDLTAFTGTLAVDTGSVELTGNTTSSYKTLANLASLTLAEGRKLTVLAPSTSTAPGVLATASISVAPVAFLDLTSNDLIITAPTDRNALRALIAQWQTFNESGIGSSTADRSQITFSVFDNSVRGLPYFTAYDGLDLTADATIVKYTFIGDVNLDGAVDGKDLTTAIEGYTLGLTGWNNGDVDNSGGPVTLADVSAITAALGRSGLSSGSGIINPDAGSIPEPTSLALLAATLPLLSRRRR